MLKAYLQSVQAWIEQGCPDGAPFWRNEGLCGNCYYFTKSPPASYELRQLLHREFKFSGLSCSVPFNLSYAHLLAEVSLKTVYENPQRLDWIKRHAQDSN